MGNTAPRTLEERAPRYLCESDSPLHPVASGYEDAHAGFDQKVWAYRDRAAGNIAHARTSDIVANLQGGLHDLSGILVLAATIIW